MSLADGYLKREDALRLVSEQGLSVNIPYGYQSIEYFAFRGLGITSVIIPDSVVSIGDEAFESNNLVSLTIPASVNFIGLHAFNRNNLSNVTINSSGTIRDYAFAWIFGFVEAWIWGNYSHIASQYDLFITNTLSIYENKIKLGRKNLINSLEQLVLIRNVVSNLGNGNNENGKKLDSFKRYRGQYGHLMGIQG